ncbi:MAG: acyltransferase [Verrucomicrobiae bacterium]|nr:acyltransferase [Verrucomicrobiae bacterium]
MGILRLYLALCVLVTHAPPRLPLGPHRGHEAVQIFFIISGFYMAMIYDKYASNLEFYCSRFIRIFVPYWTICIGIIVTCFVLGNVYGVWGSLEPYMDYNRLNGIAGVIVVTIANILIFGQDVVMFLAHDFGESLAFTTDFSVSKNPLWEYLFVPQAWSVSLELMFYLLVPFLLRFRTRYLVGLFTLSLLLRFSVYELYGLYGDPWRFRVFPFELALFLLGIFSFRISDRYKSFFATFAGRNTPKTTLGHVLFGGMLLYLFWVGAWVTKVGGVYVPLHYLEIVSYAGWAAAIPFLFCLSRKNRVDRFIGELSYPVYLIHLFVISACVVIVPYLGRLKDFEMSLIVLPAIVSILLSICLVLVVIYPLDGIRYKLAKRFAERALVSPGFPADGEIAEEKSRPH